MNTQDQYQLAPEIRAGTYVVIAAFNESRTIARVVEELTQKQFKVVVVDDGSRDDTRLLAFGAGATVLRHVINRGQGAALQTGISYSLKQDANIIVTFDADGQHSVDDLPAMLEPILSGRVDIALGSRFLEKNDSIPRSRRLLLGGGILFMRIISRVRLTDAHNGFRAFTAKAARHVDIHLDRMAHASEIIDQLCRSGLPYEEVPVHIRYTEYTLSKGQRSSNAIRVAADYLMNKILG